MVKLDEIMKNKENNSVNPEDRKGVKHPGSTSDQEHISIKHVKSNPGIPNSGGQNANQTDNKQGNVNRGNQSPDKQGKRG